MKVKENLASVLKEAGLNDMSEMALSGYYSDFESELATPIMTLVFDLIKANRPDLATRAKNGEWDG